MEGPKYINHICQAFKFCSDADKELLIAAGKDLEREFLNTDGIWLTDDNGEPLDGRVYRCKVPPLPVFFDEPWISDLDYGIRVVNEDGTGRYGTYAGARQIGAMWTAAPAPASSGDWQKAEGKKFDNTDWNKKFERREDCPHCNDMDAELGPRRGVIVGEGNVLVCGHCKLPLSRHIPKEPERCDLCKDGWKAGMAAYKDGEDTMRCSKCQLPIKAPAPRGATAQPQPRYELQHGKYGHYFYDNHSGGGMALTDVLALLNSIQEPPEVPQKKRRRKPKPVQMCENCDNTLNACTCTDDDLEPVPDMWD